MDEKAMTLEQKVELSRQRLHQAWEATQGQGAAVAWTGGKDSTVTLKLWQKVLQDKAGAEVSAEAVSVDTGLKFQEVSAFRDWWAEQWKVVVLMARPEVDLSAYPVAEDPVRCCQDLKIVPLKKTISRHGLQVLMTGVRADENENRSSRSWTEARYDPAYTMIHPLLHWTEMDVWAFTLQEDLPFCPLYDQGYRSLGCQPCTRPSDQAERSGRNPDKESRLDMLRSLGYF